MSDWFEAYLAAWGTLDDYWNGAAYKVPNI